MTWLLIAGGMFFSTPTVNQPDEPDLTNYTLLAERVLAREVVTRNRWGTPMLPDGKGGYSVIASVNPDFISASLIQPPKTGGPVFRPARPTVEVTQIPDDLLVIE
jgi:hypothetical protein